MLRREPGLAAVSVRAWAIALACGTWLGCDGGGDCIPTEDLSGNWHGTFPTSKNPNAAVDIFIEDEGSELRGNFSISPGGSGSFSGLQNGGTIVITGVLDGACAAELSGTINSCGEALTLRLSGEDCAGKFQGTGHLRRDMPPDGGSGSCEYADDGECDEPEGSGLCEQGTDPKDCGGNVCVGSACNEPPTVDCRVSPSACPSTCPFTNDGVCDENNGQCAFGTDTADCAMPPLSCNHTNDGVCDEPEGTGICPEGTDFSDCFTMVPPTGCQLTNDGICDEPEGTGACREGTDVTDCFQQPPDLTMCVAAVDAATNGMLVGACGACLCRADIEATIECSADCFALANCVSRECPALSNGMNDVPCITAQCADYLGAASETMAVPFGECAADCFFMAEPCNDDASTCGS